MNRLKIGPRLIASFSLVAGLLVVGSTLALWQAEEVRLAAIKVHQANLKMAALLSEPVRQVMDQAEKLAHSELSKSLELLAIHQQQARFTLAAAGAAGIVLAVLLGMAVTRSIVRPLSRLAEGAENLAKGNFQHRIGLAGEDELAQLGRAFDRTSIMLESLYNRLFESETYYRSLIENVSDVICILDGEGCVTFISPSVKDTLGYQVEEIIGGEAMDFIHPEDRPAAREQLENEVAQGGPPPSARLRLKHADGGYRWVEARGSNLLSHPQVAGFIVVFRDVTEQIKHGKQRKSLESQLRQSQKMEALGTLAGGIAHDFNNILTSLLGFCEISLLDQELAGKQQGNLLQIKIAALRGRELVKQILSFSRQSEQAKTPLNPRPVIEEALQLLEASLPLNVQLLKIMAPIRGRVLADPTQLHQVVMNLCTNAVQAMEETGGQIQVFLEEVALDSKQAASLENIQPGNYLRLGVSDNGPGMSPEVVARAFDPFFTTKGPGKGTGLGLSVVHGIVKSHSGAISLATTPGEGTGFFIYLPLLAPKTSDRQEDGPRTMPGGCEKVLFVDDEEAIVQATTGLLASLGYQVVSALSGEDALFKLWLAPNGFDLLISDVAMPRMTGLELASKVRERGSSIPVILATGYESQSLKAECQRLNVAGVLSKPYTLHELNHRIREALRSGGPS